MCGRQPFLEQHLRRDVVDRLTGRSTDGARTTLSFVGGQVLLLKKNLQPELGERPGELLAPSGGRPL